MRLAEFAAGAALTGMMLLAESGSANAANTEPLEAITARYNARFDMFYDAGSSEVFWYHTLKGDCNQDGLVTINDLSALGSHLGTAVNAGNLHTAAAASDCNGDGLVTINDLSAMGANLGQRLTGYNVYWEYDFAPGYPLHSDLVDEELVSWKTILDYEFDAQGDRATDHLRYSIDAGAEGAEKMWFWAEEELAGPVGQLSKLKMATNSPNTSINTYDPNWGLSYDPGTMTLSYYPEFRGDIDGNWEVSLSDINPIGVFFGQDGPWQLSEREWGVDVYRDDAIDFGDFIPIAPLFFGQAISGYNIYYLPAGGDPLPHSDSGILIGSPTGSIEGERYQATVTLNATQATPGNVVWVRPVAMDGELGARSEVLTIP